MKFTSEWGTWQLCTRHGCLEIRQGLHTLEFKLLDGTGSTSTHTRGTRSHSGRHVLLTYRAAFPRDIPGSQFPCRGWDNDALSPLEIKLHTSSRTGLGEGRGWGLLLITKISTCNPTSHQPSLPHKVLCKSFHSENGWHLWGSFKNS